MDIVADIGGTNARFAVLEDATDGQLDAIRRYRTSEFPQLEDAIKQYINDICADGMAAQLSRLSLAVAGPVEQDRFTFSNNQWSFSKSELKSTFRLNQLTVINDFTAQALSALKPEASSRRLIRAGTPVANSPILVLGPGTGLGFSALIPASSHFVPLETEGGQVSLSAHTEEEAKLLDQLRKKLNPDKLVAEDVLSGRGLEALHNILSSGDHINAADISLRARSGDDIAIATIHHFLNFLGSFIADGIVALGARQAVYICGGMTHRLDRFLDTSQFLDRLSKHNHFSDYVSQVPIYLCDDDNAGLRGAGFALDNPSLAHRHL